MVAGRVSITRKLNLDTLPHCCHGLLKKCKKKSYFTYQMNVLLKGKTEKCPHGKISEFFSDRTRSDKTDKYFIYTNISFHQILYIHFRLKHILWRLFGVDNSKSKNQTPNNPRTNSCMISPRVWKNECTFIWTKCTTNQ